MCSMKSHVWNAFQHAIEGKRLFLFGVGKGTDYFFEWWKWDIKIEGVVDNNAKKQRKSIRDFLANAWEFMEKDIFISDKSVLQNYCPEEIAVLVCSMNYYEQIAEELKEMGIKNVYSLKEMWDENDKSPIKEQYVRYVKSCLYKPIEKKKIVFRAFSDYGDHEKYITEAILKFRKDLDLVWLVSDLNVEVPNGVRLVLISNWKKRIYELQTAKVWISDLAMYDYVEKRPEQIYIQTKHWASITLKKFYLDTVAFKKEPEKLALWKRESQIIDYIITGSDFDTESCKRGFGIEGEFLEIGSPRSDIMFKADESKYKIAKRLNIDEECNILLYAPTYRFDSEKGNSVHESKNIEMDFEMIRKALDRRFTGKWCILLRLHPSVKKAVKGMLLPEFVVDASDYTDSQELVAAADITVSDYSSIMFEPAFVKKPVFLFAKDKKEYIDKEYDLLIDYDTLPFPIAESNEELVRNIEKFDKEVYEQNVTLFLDKYGVHEDGHASERAAQFISSLIGE